MNKSIILALAAAGTLLTAGAARAADVQWSVGINLPVPRIVLPLPPGLVITGAPQYREPARVYAPVPAYAPAPVMVAVYDWTGFYIGANGGYGTSRNCWGLVPVGGVVIPDGCHSQSGGIIGGQLGYRWQSGPMVFGLEAQGVRAEKGVAGVMRLHLHLNDRFR